MRELVSLLDLAEASEVRLRTLRAPISNGEAAHWADNSGDTVVGLVVVQQVVGTLIAADTDNYHFEAGDPTKYCHRQPSEKDLHQVDTSCF